MALMSRFSKIPLRLFRCSTDRYIQGELGSSKVEIDLVIVAKRQSFPQLIGNRQFYALIWFGNRNMIPDYPNSCLTRRKAPDPLQKNSEAQAGSCKKLEMDGCPRQPGY